MPSEESATISPAAMQALIHDVGLALIHISAALMHQPSFDPTAFRSALASWKEQIGDDHLAYHSLTDDLLDAAGRRLT